MKIELAYGKKGLEFEMPTEAKPVVIRKPPFVIPEDSNQVIREASRMTWLESSGITKGGLRMTTGLASVGISNSNPFFP